MTDKCPRQVSGEAKHRCWGEQHKCFHMSRRSRWLLDCSHAQGSLPRIGCHLHGTLTFLSPIADRQTDKQEVTCLLFFIPCGALSRFLSRSRLLLCWMLDLHSSASSSSPSIISPHQSKGPKDPPLSDLITLDIRFQLHSEVTGFNNITKMQATSILSFALAVG